MSRPINNLHEFHFHKDGLNHRFGYHSTLNALLQVLFQVSTRSFICTRKILLKIAPVTRKSSGLAKVLQQFLCRKRHWAIVEKHKRYRFFLCSLATKQPICISLQFYWRKITFVICMTDFTRKSFNNTLCHQVWRQVFLSATLKREFQVHLSQLKLLETNF